MKSLYDICRYSLSVLFIICLCYSCKQENTPLDEEKESYTVAVRFPGFESTIRPFELTLGSALLADKVSSNGLVATGEEGYLYYWSFNEGTILPDIAVDTLVSINFNGIMKPKSFESIGWASHGFPAGKAMTIVGLENLVFHFPLTGIQKIRSFGFDISSFGAGPNSFDLYYAQEVDTYKPLVSDNQFTSLTGTYPKNSFIYYIDTLRLDYQLPLYIKLVPKAGHRGHGLDYHAQTGIVRMDNIFLSGMKHGKTFSKIRQLRYHIVDVLTKKSILAGEAPFAENTLPTLFFDLPIGDYKGSFVSNDSDAELLISEQTGSDQFYFGNLFTNREAKIYGTELDFAVYKELEFDLLLRRYYSQVKFEFTDNRDLSTVRRIIVTQDHPSFYYAPFTAITTNPIVDQTEINQTVNFKTGSKELLFNQFMGNLTVAHPVSYTLRVYNQGNKLLRTFTVKAAIKNNVRLIFRGELLGGGDVKANFTVRYQETWDNDYTIDF